MVSAGSYFCEGEHFGAMLVAIGTAVASAVAFGCCRCYCCCERGMFYELSGSNFVVPRGQSLSVAVFAVQLSLLPWLPRLRLQMLLPAVTI